MNNPINVLVVEDSPAVQLLLVHLLNGDPRLKVIGTAGDGEEALELIQRVKPDVIVMDVHMPRLDGYETTRRIMETQPVPIVVCSASLNPEEVANTFRALEAGAVALVAKPLGPGHPDFAATTAKFLETVVLMSEIKVVRRWARLRRVGQPPVKAPGRARGTEAPVQVVAIGASTGGPPVLQTILTGLPPDFAVPVLIVQHIASGFVGGLAEWLTQTTGFPVRVASQGEPLLAGRAYLAPDGHHLGIDAHQRIALDKSQPENGLRPAVSYLFRSVATHCGSRAVGVLLTGMGRDGADELKHLHDLGAATIAQDAESSAVFGMPGEAAKLGAVSYTLSPDRIPLALIGLVATSPESAARRIER